MTLAQLADIEAIKQLKARYFRCMDSRDWSGLANCFIADLSADFRGAPGDLVEGRDNYMAYLQAALENAQTVHHGHTPEIELVGDNEATGVWAMYDLVDMPGIMLRGWGHYHERYRKEKGNWYICALRLTRLRLEINGEVREVGQDAGV